MNAEQSNYRSHLEKAPLILEEFNDQIQTLIINLAMSGESSHLDDMFTEGDELTFKYDDFKDSSDVNVRILYGIFNLIQDERAKIININSLKVDSNSNEDDFPF